MPCSDIHCSKKPPSQSTMHQLSNNRIQSGPRPKSQPVCKCVPIVHLFKHHWCLGFFFMSPFLSFHLFKYCPQDNNSRSILQSGSGNFIILGPDTQPILFNFRNIFSRQDTPPYLPLGPSMTIRPFCLPFHNQGLSL